MYKRVALLILFAGLSLSASPRKRGWLGVYPEDLSKAARIAIGVEYGVLVEDVIEKSPADKAGIEIGDVIMEMDGEKIEECEDLHWVVKKRPNKKVNVLLFRKGEEKRVEVELGEMEEEFPCPWEFLKFPYKRLGPIQIWKTPSLKKELKDLHKEIEKLRREIEELHKEIRGT